MRFTIRQSRRSAYTWTATAYLDDEPLEIGHGLTQLEALSELLEVIAREHDIDDGDASVEGVEVRA